MFAYSLDDIHFKPFHVLCMQLIGAYISKKMTDHKKKMFYHCLLM
jgi:hypothetical protein